jgi:signal transduction histidine kinase
MNVFRVLLVEDNLTWARNLRQNLDTVTVKELTGIEYDNKMPLIDHVADQKAASAAVAKAEPGDYDLILLDLMYPESPENEVDEEGDGPFQGMKWLPELRRLQPHAAIVILTSYPGRTLDNVVKAIRDHHANDFLPKTAPFPELVTRIRFACERLRQRRVLTLLESEYRVLRRSHAARTYAEDVDRLLGQTKTSLFRIAQQIESRDPVAIQETPEKIRAECRSLRQEFLSLSKLLHHGHEPCRHVDVVELVRQVLTLYELQAEEAGARIVEPDRRQSIWLNTYESDLRIAMHEVVSNAIDALRESQRNTLERQLTVTVSPGDDECVIVVADNGDGISDDVLNRLGEAGVSTRNDGRHQGIGVHIAQRMMEAIGGSFHPCNRPEGGAEVRLTVRNLPCP